RHGTISQNLGALAANLADSFGTAGGILAVLGLWWLLRHRRDVGIALVLAFLTTGPLFMAYANPPLGGLLAGVFARFYILPSIPLAMIIGFGSWQLLEWVARIVSATLQARQPHFRFAASGLVSVLLLAVVIGPASGRYDSVDQSDNRMTINFVRDMLAPLDRDAILLTEGDTAVLGTWYAQNAEGYRPDVTVIAVPLLHFQWYIDEMRRRHPDVTIPFEAIDIAGKPATDLVVDANFALRPIYYVGVIDEAFPAGYGELRTGFARKFALAADVTDPFDYVRTHIEELEGYHFPTRSYPTSTWENWESSYYSGAAFDLANAYELVDVATAVHWYRTAIRINPGNGAAYKNLAILLSANSGQPAEIADLLEQYLVMAPQDPEAETIRASIAQLRGTSP
ncbi:MAG: tetratricopeptide repeat protein, partial [Dehalococcoidia bacterium]